jgi:predicted phosphodiesterase
MRLLLTAALAAASAALPATANADPVVLGPYLQRLSAKGVEIRVETLAHEVASLEVESDDHTKRAFNDASGAFHSFQVTDLVPQTHYRYRVSVGKRAALAGDFVTAPPDDGREPFSFVVYGDNRTDDDAHASVVRAIRRESFDFLVHTGDFVANGGDLLQWHEFFRIEGDLLRNRCLFSCVGNHELVEDAAAANYVRYLGPGGRDAKLYGSFRWGSARFFLLNAFEDWALEERSWLEAELTRADAEPGLAWRFVVVHHSPWSSGHHGDDVKMLMAGVPDLLVRHRVDLVLAGHDHIYERGENHGLKYIVSGGAGAPLYPDITPKPSTRKAEATHHFVLVSVDERSVRVIAKRPDGSTIESCGFAARASWDCDRDASPKPAADAAPAAAQIAAPDPPRSNPPRWGCSVASARGAGEGAAALLFFGLALGLRARKGARQGQCWPPRSRVRHED